jgi:putative MATE family efflux protein
MAQNSTADLTSGPLLKKIILFSLPLALSSLLQLLFNAADVVVVGRFAGSTALAAVGSNGSLINLLTNLFIGLSVGANVVAARCFGAKDEAGVRDTVHTSILLSVVCGAVLAVVGFFSARFLLELMSCPEDVIDLSSLYLKIYFCGMPVSMLYNFSAALLRAAGDTKRPLYFLATAGVINVMLNLVFVIGFKLSVAGVALATVISQAVSAYLVVRLLMREEGPMHLDLRQLRIHKATFVQILRIGLPAGLQSTVFSLSNVVIQSSINSFGSTVVAGNSAAANLEGFVYVGMNAFSQGCVTFTSQNLGARKYENLDRVLRDCLGCVAVTGLVLGLGCSFSGNILLQLYSSDAQVIAAGMARLSIICRLYFLCGCMDVMAGCLRGLGYSVMPMIVSLVGSCALRLVWIATVFQLFRSTATLYLSYPISWGLTLLAHLVCFFIVRHKLMQKGRAEQNAAKAA